MSILDDKHILIAEKLRLLRDEYKLTTTQMARLLGFKSQSSISNVEFKRSYPSFEALMNIMFSFGVSLHWLIGYSNKEYEGEILTRIETITPAFPKEIDIPYDYINEKIRQQVYSLRARANIIFLRNLLSANENELKKKQKTGIQILKEILKSKEAFYKSQAEEVENSIPNIVQTLRKLNIQCTPIFQAVRVTQILGINVQFQMTKEDILSYCLEHKNNIAGTACFFLEKIYPTLKMDSRIYSDKKLREQLENIWQKAYRIRNYE